MTPPLTPVECNLPNTSSFPLSQINEINTGHVSKCELLCISMVFHEGSDVLTAQGLQAIKDLFDFARMDIADICHEICNLRVLADQYLNEEDPNFTSPLLSVICLSTLWSPRISLTD